MTLSGNWQ